MSTIELEVADHAERLNFGNDAYFIVLPINPIAQAC